MREAGGGYGRGGYGMTGTISRPGLIVADVDLGSGGAVGWQCVGCGGCGSRRGLTENGIGSHTSSSHCSSHSSSGSSRRGINGRSDNHARTTRNIREATLSRGAPRALSVGTGRRARRVGGGPIDAAVIVHFLEMSMADATGCGLEEPMEEEEAIEGGDSLEEGYALVFFHFSLMEVGTVKLVQSLWISLLS
jgi:hypothetical protein